jgi:hypothetical protein
MVSQWNDRGDHASARMDAVILSADTVPSVSCAAAHGGARWSTTFTATIALDDMSDCDHEQPIGYGNPGRRARAMLSAPF